MPLAAARQGWRVTLVSIEAGQTLRNRLAEIGLVPGVEIEVLSASRRGPVCISVKGGRLMLGREMAEKIVVQ